MSWNPQYDQIGKTFVQQYYTCFDDPTQRASVAAFYDEEKSLMTFEDQQLFGRTKIMEKIQCGNQLYSASYIKIRVEYNENPESSTQYRFNISEDCSYDNRHRYTSNV